MKVPVSTTSSLSQSQQPYKSHSDPRLGSVWVVRLALSPFIKNPYGKDKDGNICNNNYEQGAMSDFFGSGDILLLHCNGLERYVMSRHIMLHLFDFLNLIIMCQSIKLHLLIYFVLFNFIFLRSIVGYSL